MYNPNDLNLPYPVPENNFPHATMNDKLTSHNSNQSEHFKHQNEGKDDSEHHHQDHKSHEGGCGDYSHGCEDIPQFETNNTNTTTITTSTENTQQLFYDTEGVLKSIFSTPIIMIECTYLHNDMETEAEKRGHVVWSYLRPIISQQFHPINQINNNNNNNNNEIKENENQNNFHKTFILIHFSLRYSDSEIVSFFMNSEECGLLNPSQTPPHDNTELPPHIILWLDTGLVRLWFNFN